MALHAVTGGAGFIGSHLCDALLAAGHAVRVLDDLSTGRRENLDPRCELLVGDVADAGAVARLLDGPVAGVFHLAAVASVARSNEDWPGTHRTNMAGTVAVLDAARAAGCAPVVLASSAAVYGNRGEGGPVREDAVAPAPLTAYGADKLGCELHAAVARGVHGVPALALRFFNVYGPRQDPSSPYSGVISVFAARVAAGLPLALHGGGAQTRDFVYVTDVVAHLLAGMAALRSGREGLPVALNVCTGRPTSVRELAEALGRVAGRAPDLRPGPARAGDIRASLGDPTLATAALGVSASVGLEEGLRRTLLAAAGHDGAAGAALRPRAA